jgi:alpha-D-xyloside xylohydrolase
MLFEQEGLQIQEGFQRLESLSLIEMFPEGARFAYQYGVIKVSFYTPGIVRIQTEPDAPTDYGLLSAGPQWMDVQVEQTQAGYKLVSGNLAVELLNGPLRLRLVRDHQVLLESATDRTINGELRMAPFASGKGEWLISLALTSDVAVYGLGEKWGRLNRRGERVTSWNRDATTVNAEISYKNSPFAWSPDGWGVFINTPARVTHGVGYAPWSHRTYVIKLHDPHLDLFLLAADNPAAMLEKYTSLTGRAPTLPRWSYGMWMARAYYQTAEETLDVCKKLRERQIPCDVILLDGRAWHKMDVRFDFKWDPDRYPDPASFVRQLKEMNIRLCLWEYPYISARNPLFNELAQKGYLLRTLEGEVYLHKWLPEPFSTLIPHLMPSGIIDFTNREAYNWYRDAHRELFEMGVAVMKTDYGEAVPESVVASNGDTGKRLHNVYALLYNQCVYEATKIYGQGEPLVWGRAAWTGSQRYPMQWGGDPQVDWEGLAASTRGGLSWGLSGAPYYTHDIGGFAIGKPAPELYVRWAQAGVMTSHTRFHGIGPREPWEYGPQAEQIVRQWVEFRYRLIPYLEACALEASRTSLPVMRAMPLAFPEDTISWNFEEQYMFGPSLLVAPVLKSGGKVRVYLPAGTWYDLWTGQRQEGPCLKEVSVPLHQIPIYGREGYILPLGPAVQHTGELNVSPHLEEVWAFGPARHALQLPGFEGDWLTNLRANIIVQEWSSKAEQKTNLSKYIHE